MRTEELVERLASHRTIGQAPREELAWIATNGTLRQFQPGEVVSRQTEVVDGLYILLSGCISIYSYRGTVRRKLMEWRGGDVVGILPYSRLLTPPGDSVVEEAAEAVAFSRDDLPAMIRNCYEVTAILVHVMTDRARRFNSADLRDEKMISLGKLAAGLAHELNNPASAAMRSAKSLAGALTAADEAIHTLGANGLTGAQRAELDEVHKRCVSAAPQRSLSGLALADREEALADWLRAHGTDTGDAEELARASITNEELDRLALALRGPSLTMALRWIAAGCTARSLAFDIERATARIHTLVTAVKGFTHMDRAPEQEPVDVPAGLADTAALLDGKARTRSVTITLNIAPDLPPIRGLSAEINQVWMNLIDNAIDAAPVNGHVTVTAAHDGADVVVRVLDDGPGIPSDIRESIFDPFFTTKSVGQGTGLGLDIARRVAHWHGGDIELDTRPGRTEFRVRVPALLS
jgi:signal transduction histidine kinase